MKFFILLLFLTSQLTSVVKIRMIAGLLALGLWLGGIYKGKPRPDGLRWETWSPQRVVELRKKGEPIWIEFMAKWGGISQIHSRIYKDSEIVRLAEEKEIRWLRADWTKVDDQITEALASYGRSAIPVHVLYIPGQQEPEIIPNLLTKELVREYWEKIPTP